MPSCDATLPAKLAGSARVCLARASFLDEARLMNHTGKP
jgi:hypothetical protein